MACIMMIMMMDRIAVVFICFGDAVAVVDNASVDERSYVNETVTLLALYAAVEPCLAHHAVFRDTILGGGRIEGGL